MLKVGLVGIGGMGSVHFNAYKTLETAEVVAVADVRVDMAKEKVQGTEAKVYSSLTELLENEKVDMIDICTPSFMHTELSIQALSAGCHVLCEKPMSISTEDTARVIETAKKAGKNFMTAHVVRFMAPYVYLRSVIESGELGKVVHIDMTRISSIPRWSWEDWMRDVNKSGGSPIDLSIHDIDFTRYVFGEPKEVSGVYKKLNSDNNDFIISNLVYDGFTVSIKGGWYNATIPFNASYYAVFENGIVSLSDGKVYKNGEEVKFNVSEEEISETEINIPKADGYTAEIEYFTDCIINGTSPERVTPESSEASVRLVERIIANAILI